jgi:hypothetical protein
MVSRRAFAAAIVLVASAASAQPVTQPEPDPVLATIRDEKQLSEALTTIAQDPAVRVDDPKMRPLAQALMTEGVKQLQASAYDQALANFLEAYAKLPSPKILLNIASTLRDMGRLADAANTYQRYLSDPATTADRIAEVKELLLRLDQQLTILTIRVVPHGSELSIDGGPFVAVGTSLVTRVRPGIHLVRVRKRDVSSEQTVNAFEGENQEVSAILQMDVADQGSGTGSASRPTAEQGSGTGSASSDIVTPALETELPEKVDGWLITGTQYGADSATGHARRVRTGFTGPEVAPIVPRYDVDDNNLAVVEAPEEHIAPGVIAIMRIDPKLRGFAGGLGIALVPRDHIEVEIAGLRSDVWGAYLGARYRFLTGWFRPYLGIGAPVFFFRNFDMEARVSVGTRAAGGLELFINGHLSVQADLGFEHFFFVNNSRYEKDADLFVPTIGLIGRM